MTTSTVRSAFQSAGEAQLLAAEGQMELSRLISRMIANGFNSLVSRFRRPRAESQSFV
jgi:hypothetical protein